MRAFHLALPAAVMLAAGPAPAAEDVILDYRDDAFLTGQAFYSEAERREVGSLLKAAAPEAAAEMGEDFVILGDAGGSFPEGGKHVHLIQEKAPVAIEPFPDEAPPVLLVTGGRSATVFRLPQDVQYHRLVAAADGDADGQDEILLESSFTNMGQTVTALDVVRLDGGGQAAVALTLKDVHVEACDNPQGETTRSASTIRVGAKGFEATPHALPCP